MPAKYPRLTITMRPGMHAMLQRLSELTGNSMSSLIFDLLDGSETFLMRTIRTLEKAEMAREDMRGKLTKDMETAQARIEQQLAIALDDFGHEGGELFAQGQAELRELEDEPKRRRRKGAAAQPSARAAAEPTPISNRGVRSLTNTVENHSHGQVRRVR